MSKPYSSTYPHFSPNQVLTDTQLNQMHDFLEGQNRLTRTHGIGAGIVCGLEAEYRYLQQCEEYVVMVESGYGFSSDGYLMSLSEPTPTEQSGESDGKKAKRDRSACMKTLPDESWVFTHVRAYQWPEGDSVDPPYDAWKEGKRTMEKVGTYQLNTQRPANTRQAAMRKFSTPSGQPVYELLTSGDTIQSDTTNAPEALTELHLQGHSVVLYLEKGKSEDKPCIETDCSRNDQISHRIRVLLVDTNCLKKPDGCYKPELIHIQRLHTQLPSLGELAIREENINSAYGAIINGDGQSNPVDHIWEKICEAHDRYDNLLEFDVNLYDLGKKLKRIFSHLDDDGNSDTAEYKANDTRYHQYHYDLLKDLATGYNEFITEVCQLTNGCEPADGFPRHLALTSFGPSDQAQNRVKQLAAYRNEFIPSPVANVTNRDKAQVRKLFLRLHDMIMGFRFGLDIASFSSVEDPIRITPSQTEVYPLGRRAIPYYYDLESAHKEFLSNWQPDHCCVNEEVLSHAFHDAEGRQPRALTRYQQSPLGYQILGKTFYRIEGHIGKTPSDIFEDLDSHIINHNLEIDVIALYLNTQQGEITSIVDGQFARIHQIQLNENIRAQLFTQLIGMEHGAGVTPGGTFVIVFDEVCIGETPNGQQIMQTIAVADFFLERNLICCLNQPQSIRGSSSSPANVQSSPVFSSESVGEMASRSVSPSTTTANRPTSFEIPVLATRSSNYYDEVLSFNKHFSGNQSYQAALDFIQSDQPLSQSLGSYAETNTRILNSFSRTSDNNKKQAYRQILERLAHKALDLAIAETDSGLDATAMEDLTDQLKKLKDKGISLSRIKTNWKVKELPSNATVTSLKQLLK